MLIIPDEFKKFLESDAGELLRGDVAGWSKWRRRKLDPTPQGYVDEFAYLMGTFQPFRNQFDYRIRKSGVFNTSKLLFADLRRCSDLSITAEHIGPGMLIGHGHGTYIYARTIGRDFQFNQMVTVGHDGKNGIPNIGDGVMIKTGAVVVGKIEIGDNVFIGANAVVNFDVPPNMRVLAPRAVMTPRRTKT